MCGYLECSDNQTCGKKAGEDACIDKPPSEFEQAAKTLCPSATVTSANSAYINKGTDDICCHEEWWEGTWLPLCDPNKLSENQWGNTSPQSVMGITCNEKLLVNGQCKLNIYDTLWIRKSVRNKGDATSVGLFVQDVVLSATFFIGTLVTIALIVSGIMFIFASSSGKDPANAKKGIIGSLVGLLIVVSSYVIIRLVQYVAKGF